MVLAQLDFGQGACLPVPDREDALAPVWLKLQRICAAEIHRLRKIFHSAQEDVVEHGLEQNEITKRLGGTNHS